jgi:hypothetical protein
MLSHWTVNAITSRAGREGESEHDVSVHCRIHKPPASCREVTCLMDSSLQLPLLASQFGHRAFRSMKMIKTDRPI